MKAKQFFWFLEGLNKSIWKPFWWILPLAIVLYVPFLRIWWWFFLPILLFFPLRKYYLWWIAWDFQYFENARWVVLELTPPKEVLAPLTAMEDVFNIVWSIIDSANWREIWCEGEFSAYPYWCSWEIAGIEGTVHFYIRCLAAHVQVVESVLYSHYPEVEIREVPDYTKNVPQQIPNEEWDMYGEDYVSGMEDAYPIRTYSKFFEPQGERIAQEEKRVDPVASLLEGMGRLKEGEQVWLHFITTPVQIDGTPVLAEAKELIHKLSRRPTKKRMTLWDHIQEAFTELVTGMFAPDTIWGENAIPPRRDEEGDREMLLTPGEKEVLLAVEDKVKKLIWKTNIRGMYVAKRSAWKKDNRLITRAYFTHFNAPNLNHIRFWGDTRPKVHFFMRERRRIYRQKTMHRNGLARFTPKFPVMDGPGNCFYNSEELATMWHFPTKITSISVPTTAYVEAKKGGPPANLPVEE